MGITTLLLVIVGVPFAERMYRVAAARKCLNLRDAQGALQHLQRAEHIAPSNADVQILLGRTYRRLGNLDLVRVHLERAWKLGIPEKVIRREEYLAMAQAGQLREALPQLSDLLRNPGDDGPEICEAFAKGFYLTFQYGHAYALLDVWQADYPTDPQPLYMRGMLASQDGNLNSAIDSLRKAHSLAPDRRDIQSSLSELLVQAHNYQEAEDLLRPLLKNDPDNPLLLTQLGTCLMERGELEQSRDLYARAIHLQHDSAPARLAMGQLELKFGHPELAIDWLSPLAAERPYDSRTRFALASALQSLGKAEQAKEHFLFVEQAQKAIARMHNLMDQVKSKSEDVEMRYEIGTILMKYESPTEGARWLRSVLELQPNHRPTHVLLAEYYHSIGNDKLAERHRRQSQD